MMRRYFFIAWLLYLLFVVYGSLVPLDFHPKPISEALMAFRHIRYLDLGVGNRADWVANLLLFVPLAFLSLAVLAPGQKAILLVVLSVMIGAGCVGLSVAIEFTQIFFPPRTVSLNDIIAETIGAFCGILAWWVVGRRVADWLAQWHESAQAQESYWFRAAQFYVATLVLYNIMPLDLTISPVEIFHKWNAGRVVLMPFSFRFAGPAQLLYGSITDVAIWIPVALFLILSGRCSMSAWFITVAFSVLIEFLQLFVYTRVTDVTQIILAAFGGWIGVWVAKKFGHGAASASTPVPTADEVIPRRYHRGLGWTAVFCAWTVILAIVFWYPYNFTIERAFVAERVRRILHAVPFQAYYYGTEFRALTEAFHKTLFFIPLGVAAAIISRSMPGAKWRTFAAVIGIVAISSVAIAIDLGRLLLPDKRVDVADWLFQLVGGLIGFAATWKYVGVRLRMSAHNVNGPDHIVADNSTRSLD